MLLVIYPFSLNKVNPPLNVALAMTVLPLMMAKIRRIFKNLFFIIIVITIISI